MTVKRIAVLIDRQYIDAHFCFRELLTSLAESGFYVTLFYIPTHNSPKIAVAKNIQLKKFSKTYGGTIKLFIQLLWGNFIYAAVIATPQWPLYWAALAKKKFKLICLSDEVNASDPNYYSTAQKNQGAGANKWKQREIIAHQKCDATIALGEIRYKLLKHINKLADNHPYFIIANAPSAKLASKPATDFYRKQFNLSKQNTIVLHSGGLQWKLIQDLPSINLDADTKLILQARMKNDLKFTSSAILISDTYIAYEDLISYTKDADIGLLLYDENDPEEKRNGNTAGKLGLYLGAGLPIIGCNLKEFEWLEKENCGVRIENLSQLNEAVNKIKSNYNLYAANSKRIFENKFEYLKQYKPFEKWLTEKK